MADETVSGVKELSIIFNNLEDAAKGVLLGNVAMAGAKVIVNHAKKNVKDTFENKSGELSRSIHRELRSATDTKAVAEAGTNLVYGPVQEFGGVIKPKSKKYLAIPVGTYKGSPNIHPDLKFRDASGDTVVMVDGSGNVQYVLKRSVVIPARPYLRPARDENELEIREEMSHMFRTQINKAIK